MWRKVGLAFLVLAGLLIFDSLTGKSGDSPSEMLGQLVMFSFAAAILVGIVSAWKWLRQMWSKKSGR
jgi:hypothetical protein